MHGNMNPRTQFGFTEQKKIKFFLSLFFREESTFLTFFKKVYSKKKKGA